MKPNRTAEEKAWNIIDGWTVYHAPKTTREQALELHKLIVMELNIHANEECAKSEIASMKMEARHNLGEMDGWIL